ncbi:cyclopropane-fatty-acyl-phospholipid synthase family protein [Aeromicrobium sp. IC_218]|uniref:SAM-dependent methyltransferase n=1 Tax=Aeromicrobium sp. IC_218 TaxID=2545468 RepID=UPI00103B381C|nr:cyclopropane-fatty-acyl-phospholipid synthase family protein [Aeromicrobium sp. IC_218]TCI99647.1 class I SAM-dependent methyltransferase [Aeromicrobium sp. IC_218]
MTEQLTTTRWPDLFHEPRTPLRARAARAILRTTVSRVPVRVTFPDGTSWGAGGPDSPELQVVRPASFFARLGRDTKIGLGEAYMAGDWRAAPGTDLAELLAPFAERLTALVPAPLLRLRKLVDVRLPHAERNSVEGSRSNIERHYDLSNELFMLFLDPTMSYSSADFDGTEPRVFDDLEPAQVRKIDAILDAARVGEGSRVLEIGTGWGALAIRAARRGAQVTSITISTEQAELARERVALAEVDDRVEIRLQDYREVDGEYDAVVSVEMIEAVGEEFWPTYFATIDRVLAPGGTVAIQAITMAHDRYLATRHSYGWIQKYVFPGGLIPSERAVDDVLRAHTALRVTRRRPLGTDYARTLRLWRERFIGHADEVRAAGFDETFRRMWELYLAYCEAGFAVGYLDVVQLRMERPA